MLDSFFQNISAKMTKDLYFEMCSALGTEPIEEEIPVEMEDFPEEVQEAITIYYKLRDDWDTMNGVYMGKSYVGLRDILDIMEVPLKDRKYILEWVSVMDASRSKMIQAQRPKSQTN